jgi:multiple sugar transport system substrate-binding protein
VLLGGSSLAMALLNACGQQPSAPAPTAAPKVAPTAPAAQPTAPAGAAALAAKPTAPAQAAPATAPRSATVTWWTLPSEDFDEASQRELVQAFNAKNTGIKVEPTFLPGNGYDDKMTTALGTGEAPDVAFFWLDAWLPKAKDLTPFIQRDKFETSQYLKTAWDSWAKFGTTEKIIGLPLGVGCNFLFYNNDLFKQFGVEAPQWGTTIQQWLSTIPRVTDRSKRIWGGDRPRGAFRSLFYSNGARLMTEDGTSVAGQFNSPQSIAAYEAVWDLVATNATPTTADIAALGSAATGPVDLFLAGRVASATLNQGHLGNVRKAGLNFGSINEPAWPNKEPWAHAWSLRVGMNAQAKDPDAAWEFMKFYVGPEGQKVLMDKGNLVPSWRSVLDQFPNGTDPNVQTMKKVLDLPTGNQYVNRFPYYAAVLREAQPLWDKINLQQLQRQEIATEVNALVPTLQAKLDSERKKLQA